MFRVKSLFAFLIFIGLNSFLKGQSDPSLSFRQRLDSIVTENYRQQNCYYHFARLYQRVSSGIDKLISEGKIRDTAFIMLLEESFGHYYLKNYDSIHCGTVSNYCWQKAFDTASHTNHYATALVLSMNAHVNHDLFFVLTEVFKTHPPNKDREKDFKAVAKVHDKVIKDYFENILPYLKADKKWKRQTIRKLAKQAGNGLKIERNRIWREARKAVNDEKKLGKYSKRHLKSSRAVADKILTPKGLVKKGISIADTLDAISFEEKVFLLNNERP